MNSKILLLPVIGAFTFFILLFTFTRIFGPIPFSVNSVTTTKSDEFRVSGEGEVSVTPDIAYLTVGILSNGSTVRQAQEQINSVINKVSSAIKGLDVDEKDIKTQNYSIAPTYDYTGGTQRITGYSASTNLSIKIRNLDNINSVIDASTASGANTVGGISFDVEDEPSSSSSKTKAENEAREKAVADAKKKAEAASRIAGFKLGKIINYQESGNDIIPVYRALVVEGAALPADKSTQIESGSSQIKITVTLSYEIQ